MPDHPFKGILDFRHQRNRWNIEEMHALIHPLYLIKRMTHSLLLLGHSYWLTKFSITKCTTCCDSCGVVLRRHTHTNI